MYSKFIFVSLFSFFLSQLNSRDITIIFKNCIIDSAALYEFNNDWKFVKAIKIVNQNELFICSDNSRIYRLDFKNKSIDNRSIDFYLNENRNIINIINDSVDRKDTINYILNYLGPGEIVNLKVQKKYDNFVRHDTLLSTYIKMKIAICFDLESNLYPTIYVNYFDLIPQSKNMLESFLIGNKEFQNKAFLEELSNKIGRFTALKSYYWYLITDLFNESSIMKCKLVNLMLEDKRVNWFNEEQVKNMKKWCTN